ncbi:MAG: helix-turn-helix domain-containing protein [Candidatus Omnitrophica bacterium]|nr:helix-turn-helix domain-containing protein [Candidatus Omnitrophota bacterium]
MRDTNLGKAVRKKRIEYGLKVYELARRVGVNPVYITQIEKHGKLPSASIMKQIADALYDQNLFNIYIKIKYPMLQQIIGKDLDSLEGELQEIENEFKKEDFTTKGKNDLLKRMTDFNTKLKKSDEKLREIKGSNLKLRMRLLAGK